MKTLEKQTKQDLLMTRVTLQIWEQMAVRLEENLKKLFIKRDPYLNELFKREIERLDEEFQMQSEEFGEPIKNTDAGKKILKKYAALLKSKKINIFLEKEVALRMDEVLKKYEIPRDSFCNRVIAFLGTTKKPLLNNHKYLDHKDLEVDYQDELSQIVKMNRFELAESCLLDPFCNIRENNDGLFYTLPNFPKIVKEGEKSLYALNTRVFDQIENDEYLLNDLL